MSEELQPTEEATNPTKHQEIAERLSTEESIKPIRHRKLKLISGSIIFLVVGTLSGLLFFSFYEVLKDPFFLTSINNSKDLNSRVWVKLFFTDLDLIACSYNLVLFAIPWLLFVTIFGVLNGIGLFGEAFENSFPAVGGWNITTGLFIVCMSWDTLIVSGLSLIQLSATLEPVYRVGEVWKEFGIYLRNAGGALLVWTLAQPVFREHKDILKLNKR